MRYRVYDSLGNYLRSFSTYNQAMTYKTMCQRYDWVIKEIKR
jgi:hypothetical protein|nr:MAG TPA: hypothetical protein [Crassvirales sp.]